MQDAAPARGGARRLRGPARHLHRPVRKLALGGLKPRAVLLDGFGTLVAMEPPGANLRRELLRRSVEIDEERAAHAFRAEIAYYLEHHVEGRDGESLAALRDRCAEVLRAELGDPLPLEDIREAMLAAIRFSAYEDAVPALRELRRHGMRLVVASNWDCSLPGVLNDAGLTVDAVVASAEVGFAKPDPRFFEAALRAAGVGAEEAVHVGDSPTRDIAGAQAAGIAAIHLRRSDDEPAAPGVSEIRRLTELAALLFE